MINFDVGDRVLIDLKENGQVTATVVADRGGDFYSVAPDYDPDHWYTVRGKWMTLLPADESALTA